MEEIWKDIKGYQGYNQVSTLGRVRSIDRVVGEKNKPCNGMILKWHISGKSRYYMVNLKKEGTSRFFSIHRLVAKAFIPNPDNKPQIDHIDGNPFNNIVSNLQWATASENQRNPISSQRKKKSLMGIYRPKRGDSPRAIPIIGTDILTGESRVFDSISSAADFLGIEPTKAGHISSCCRGKRNQAYGFKWKYVE